MQGNTFQVQRKEKKRKIQKGNPSSSGIPGGINRLFRELSLIVVSNKKRSVLTQFSPFVSSPFCPLKGG